MTPRLDVTKYLTSGLGRAMLALSTEAEARLERPLFELVKIRASQINGCAYCIDWNRLSISFRPPVGSYQPAAVAV